MKNSRYVAVTALLAVMLLCACPPPPPPACNEEEEDCIDAGTVPPDYCNSVDEALNDPQCKLTLGMQHQEFISTLADGGSDQDFYSVTMPGNLDARSLLHITGGYTATTTPVYFSINVLKLKSDNTLGNSITSGVDTRPVSQAAPKPVDMILPFSESNAKLIILVGDKGGSLKPIVDNTHPYGLTVSIDPNPDTNEPNDLSPTPITLAPAALNDKTSVPAGMQTGYLATNDDVDKFSFALTGSEPRKIIYLHITGPSPQITPPPNYRMTYQLLDPDGTSISEGAMDNVFQPVDLSTARLAPKDGTYTVVLKGYKMTGDSAPVKGDLRLKYNVELKVFADLDTNEPNDTQMTAVTKQLSLDTPISITGRLSYVADSEWFKVVLPQNNAPTTLRYKITPSNTGGRFPPLSTLPTRQWQIRQVITGADPVVQCKTKSSVCPKSLDATRAQADLVDNLCASATQCLWSSRLEHPEFENLKNFVGAIPIPPHSGNAEYLVGYEDEGLGYRKFADDKDFSIRLEWASDDDEAQRVSGPLQSTLTGSQSTAAGAISFGHGRAINGFDFNVGQGVRAIDDYDAVVTDTDLFRFNFGSAMGDQTWNLEWEVDKNDAGVIPAELTLDVSFCTGPAATDGGTCSGPRQTIAYRNGNTGTWYANSTFVKQFDLVSAPGSNRMSLLPITCACFSEATTTAGSFFINVQAANRVSNEPLTYRLRQSISTYPGQYPAADGGAITSCPPLMMDGGSVCKFSGN